jgi:release factor glutamine methyltransferase
MINNIKDISAEFKNKLQNIYLLNEIQQILFIVFEEYANLSKVEVITYPEKEITETQYEKIKNILSKLIEEKPIQYILGKADFYGMTFYVNNHVLIPRQETEELVDYIINHHKDRQLLSVIDFGTGSGCIAISLAANLLQPNIYAVDISTEAIKTARKNAAFSRVSVNFIKNDILNLDFSILPDKVDIIVSNPPYVCNSEKKLMKKNVLEYEPQTALFVNDNNPLIFYDKIAIAGTKLLKKKGNIIFEINEKFAMQIKNLLISKGYENIEIIKDLNGKDRIVKAVIIS